MPAIELQNVSKFYKRDHRFLIAVQNINLKIQQGEFVFIIGSSGAGKSTLLKLICGQLDPDWGNVYLGGKDLRSSPVINRRKCSTIFGIVNQRQTLNRRKTIEQNLMDAAKGGKKFVFDSGPKADERVRKVLSLVGMKGAEKKYPVELTMGECWRVEFAKALINSPPILIIDEIATNLDEGSVWDIFLFLNELNKKGTTVIMATRASEFVNILRRRVVTIVDGKVFGDVSKGRYGDIV